MTKSYPKFIKINNINYPINTSYKVALDCFKIINDENISDTERSLAIIFKLFGFIPKDKDDMQKCLDLAETYLRCGENKDNQPSKRDMDLDYDWKYIVASFMSDYGIDIKDVYKRQDYRDVPIAWLGKRLIAEAEEMKKADEKLYNWLWLGLCTGLDELIYYMFKEDIHVAEPTKKELKNIRFLGIGIDYGQMNPTTFQCFGVDFYSKAIRGIDEYYHCGREEGQKTPSDYAKDFKEFKERVEKETGKKVLYVYIDPSAKGLAEEIKRLCPEVNIKDADNTVLLGINRVQKLMALRHLFISPKQKHLIQEMPLYEWDKDLLDKGKEVPVKTNDHCQDATRYLVMGFWKFIKQMLPMLGDD